MLENIHVCYDGTVRDAQQHIISFSYGEDGLDGVSLRKIKKPS